MPRFVSRITIGYFPHGADAGPYGDASAASYLPNHPFVEMVLSVSEAVCWRNWRISRVVHRFIQIQIENVLPSEAGQHFVPCPCGIHRLPFGHAVDDLMDERKGFLFPKDRVDFVVT